MKARARAKLTDLPSHRGEKAPGRIRQRNEQLIIEAALQEFAQKGYEGASINEIARLAKLPRPNVHYYFESKLSLYQDILGDILDLWDDTLNDLDPEQTPAIALRAYIARKMAFSRTHSLESKIFAKEVLSGAPRLKTYFERGYRNWFERVLRVFHSWIDRGLMDPVDPAHLMFIIWSTTQHYADFETQICAGLGVEELGDREFSRASETVTYVILKGIGVTAEDSGFSESDPVLKAGAAD